MTDVADLIPSPALIAARERHLQELIDAPRWNPPANKPNFFPKPKAAPRAEPARDLLTIDLDVEKAAVGRLYVAWQGKLAEKLATIEYAVANHVSPGDNYWLEEAKAKARWIVASNFVDMLEQARAS